jgi:ankyrin repeat protein
MISARPVLPFAPLWRPSRALPALLAAAVFLALLLPPAQAQTILGRDPEIVQAIRAGDVPRVKSLLIQGENPNLSDFDGQNGIIIAARNADYAMIDYLIELEVPVNAADNIGSSALHWVSEGGDYDMAAYLLENGADVDQRNGRGLTPVMIAARGGYLDMVELYIDAGADLTVRDYTGRSALDWARDSRTPGLENVLIQAGAQ